MMETEILFTNKDDVVLPDQKGVVLVPLTVPKDNPAALLKAFNLKGLNLSEMGRFQCPLEISPLYRQFFLLQEEYKKNIARWIASLPDNKEKILNILGEMTTNVDNFGTILANMGKSPQLPIETQIIKQQRDLIRLAEEAIKHVVTAIQNQFKENPLVCSIVMENSNSAMNTTVRNLLVNITEDMVQYLVVQLQDRITENLLIVAMNFSRKFELAELINASDFYDRNPATVITGDPAQMLVDEKLRKLQAVSVPEIDGSAESEDVVSHEKSTFEQEKRIFEEFMKKQNIDSICEDDTTQIFIVIDQLHTLLPEISPAFQEHEGLQTLSKELYEELEFRATCYTENQIIWQKMVKDFLSLSEELVHFEIATEQTTKAVQFASLEAKLNILKFPIENANDDTISSDVRNKLLDVQKTLNTASPFYRNWLINAGGNIIQQILDVSDVAYYEVLRISAKTEILVREVQKKIYETMDSERQNDAKIFSANKGEQSVKEFLENTNSTN